ncbi:MAG: YidC/Oxa1 family membrane protein insertase [Pseudonocardiaceae bacterium]
MLDGAAEVVRLAYEVWPSYAGAFVLVSLLVGLLFVPLTIRSARSGEKLIALRPEIQRIQALHGTDLAARHTATMALYRRHGVALGPGCVLIPLRLAVLVILFMIVRGLATVDPSTGGGPRYVEQGTALWQGLKDSGGQLSWLGVDLGKTLFTQGNGIGVLVYLMLLLVFVVVSAVGMQASAGRPAYRGAGILIVTLVVALLLPGAVVLYLITDTAFSAAVIALTTKQGRLTSWWRQWFEKPHREFQAKSLEADRLDEAGRLDEAATLRLSAITEFGRKSSADRLVEYAHDIQRNLVLIAAQRPSGAISALAKLNRSCPQCVSKDMTSSVVRAWVGSPRSDRFGDDWATIETVLSSKSQDSLEVLLDACRGTPRATLTGAFRRGVTTYLWTYLDQNLRLAPPTRGQALDGHQPAFELLDLVIVPKILSRADQLCALGDLALRRASSPAALPSEALGRYEVAIRQGSTHAAERLAYHQAREGHRLLSVGKIAAARQKFAEASRLHNDQEYALLAAITDSLSDDTNALDRLEALDVTGAPVPGIAFWRAIGHLRRGEQVRAVALLRGLAQCRSDINKGWGPMEEGSVLLAVLENNDQALVDWARRVVRTYGRQWLSAGPSDPWPLVAAVARHDRDLLAEMVALVGNPRELPEWVRVAGAHAVLTKSVESARGGQAGVAAGDAELAQRLLR